jgi:hypothetical protein
MLVCAPHTYTHMRTIYIRSEIFTFVIIMHFRTFNFSMHIIIFIMIMIFFSLFHFSFSGFILNPS